MLLWLLKNFVIVCLDTKRDTLSFLPHCLFFEKVLFYLKYSEIYKKSVLAEQNTVSTVVSIKPCVNYLRQSAII